jgi:hypothetical protein
MDDNASVYTAGYTKAWYIYYGSNKMVRSAYSPNLNPIENMWRLLKYRIGKRFPKTINELHLYLIEEWDKLTLEDYLKYVEEVPQRCKAVLETNGGYIKW